ncbi:aminotransferase class IV family protein [Phytoactinopolyspora mesophila]|uniref:Branched-chain amino acid aminotransferase n=1 Tax=Phytoactinopolyspora mesophila TaxID=2650750 RepID=A0A7K3M6F8_9ACTN|nr:aminotransferase class IV family protein [Phytoactinopolyspora mesophila]NDL58856.1 branched-chain amino acid aminotransferase [Phytoactinopolyspora mesophila]
MTSYVVHRNGQEASAAELAPLAFAGYAHFTAMQVRGGHIRGLDLHLERLRHASMEMFGQVLSDDWVRSCLRRALQAGPADLSLTATVYSSAGELTAREADAGLDLLIRTRPAASGPEGPLTLAAVEYERVLPDVKHVGEVAKAYFRRRAVQQGFNDAAFVDRHGRLGEGTIWNLAFWDGSTVIWPAADMLVGTTMGIVRRQLDRLDVPQRVQEVTVADLPGLSGGVVMNSWTPGVPVHRIGSVPLPGAQSFVELLHRAYQAEPLVSP